MPSPWCSPNQTHTIHNCDWYLNNILSCLWIKQISGSESGSRPGSAMSSAPSEGGGARSKEVSQQIISLKLRDSASSFHWLSSSIFDVCRRLVGWLSRIGNISSHLHYMMFHSGSRQIGPRQIGPRAFFSSKLGPRIFWVANWALEKCLCSITGVNKKHL